MFRKELEKFLWDLLSYAYEDNKSRRILSNYFINIIFSSFVSLTMAVGAGGGELNFINELDIDIEDAAYSYYE